MRLDLLSSLNAERAARRAAIVVTNMGDGRQRLVRERDIGSDALADVLAAQLQAGKSARIESMGQEYFVELHVPAAVMVIAGAVHVSQILAPVARMLDYRVAIVDPRTAFATAERFPGIRLLAEWPDQAMPKLKLDRWTAFVALTHDPRIDDPALAAALAAGCFYVGALGSRKTHAERTKRLAASGLSADALARIHAPVGLAVGAATPGEIAIAIMAEITLRRRLGPEARP